MKINKKIGVIGAGNMGSAILKGIARKNVVYIFDKDRRRMRTARRKYRAIMEDLPGIVKRSDILILAAKPQDFGDLLKELGRLITSKKIVVSIAAGITTHFIEKKLPKSVKVIRTMPNLPAQIGEGITALAAGKAAQKADLLLVSKLFSGIGQTVIVDEKRMDAVTAVSGSGPAYVFLFMEYFYKSAKTLGLSEKVAKQLILSTIKGSVSLYEKGKESATKLRERVTSKGGTTEAAMDVFSKKETEKIFIEALKAAQKRSKQLSM